MLDTIAESMAVVCPQIANPFTVRLLRWPRRLICDTTTKTLVESRLALRSELKDFSEGVGQYLREASQTAESINTLALLFFTVLRERTEIHCKLTDVVCEQIETGADLDDANRFRSMLQQQAIGLRVNSGRMRDDIEKLLDHFTEEVRVSQARIEDPACLATTDGATGLLSRTGAVQKLRCYLESDQPSRTLVFKVEGYADIPAEEAKVPMKRVADHLIKVIRPADMASRWAEDRFFIFLRGDSFDTEPRAKQMAIGMSDRYFLHGWTHMQRVTPSVKILFWASEGRQDVWDMIERVDRA
jgi:hypothetical protein